MVHEFEDEPKKKQIELKKKKKIEPKRKQIGDIIEAVNQQWDIEKIQKELRTALCVKLRVYRAGYPEIQEQISRKSS